MPPANSPTQWIVTQTDAREHYAAARAFAGRGQLEQLYTDVWINHGRAAMTKIGGPLRALAGRCHPAIPAAKVTSFNVGGIRRVLALRKAETVDEKYAAFARTGEWFCEQVNRKLAHREIDGRRNAAFFYNTTALETIEYLHGRNIPCIVDQIDPARVEEDVVLAECEKWLGWQKSPGRIPEPYYARLSQEWAAADAVVANSEWSKQALVKQGVAAEKITVVPLAYEADAPALNLRPEITATAPLQVLFLGHVILRKGIQYLFEAARELLGENVQFIVAGRIGITELGLKAAPANVRMVGQVQRSQAAEFYRAADLFVLPTLSDGFAITQLEAMSHGLPVIATPRCGDVVTHDRDGLIVPPADSPALASAIQSLARDRDRLAACSRAAVEKASQFTLDRFAAGLESALGNSRSKGKA